MNWRIKFYNDEVKKQTLGLPAGIVDNLILTFKLIKEFGPDLGRPHTAPLGKGLFEIRAKGCEGIARSFFCSIEEKQIVVLHSINKNKMNAPKTNMNLVVKRMKEVKNG